MTQLNIVDKAAVAKAIQELYISTRKFNIVGGKAELSMERFEDQLELVKSELKETIKGLAENNLVEVVDGACDLAVTLSELVNIVSGNDDLLKDAPRYLNPENFSVETLVDCIAVSLHEGNYIDSLGYVEDLIFQLNAEMVGNCASVGASNMSKYLLLSDLNDSEYDEAYLCADLEAKGRYKDVYTEHVEVEGETWVVLKSKYDITNDEHYPKGKILKNGLSFKEPVLVVFDE